MPGNTVLEGPLSKWTNMLSGWQYRWFVLDPLNGLLSYYTSKENMSKGERRGCIRLNKGAVYVGYDSEDDITFTITVDEKTFHLQVTRDIYISPTNKNFSVPVFRSKLERRICGRN